MLPSFVLAPVLEPFYYFEPSILRGIDGASGTELWVRKFVPTAQVPRRNGRD